MAKPCGRGEVKATDGDVKKTAEQSETRAGSQAGKTARSLGEKRRRKKSAEEAESAKLRFGKKTIEPERKSPTVRKQKRLMKEAMFSAAAKARQSVSKNEDENTGVQAGNETAGAAESAVRMLETVRYSHKRKAYQRAARLEASANRKTGEALDGKGKTETVSSASNPFSRWRQKQALKKEYAARRAGRAYTGQAASSLRNPQGLARAGSAVRGTQRNLAQKAFGSVKRHAHLWLAFGVFALLMILIGGLVSSCGAFLGSTGNVLLGTSFTAEEEDIRGAEADYCAMEEALRERLRRIEEDNPGYDDYEIDLSEIGHDPYELAAFLTVLYEDYTREEVQDTLREIFSRQYEYAVSERTETVTETRQVRVGESLGPVVTSGYCNCPICCGIWSGGPTASGAYPTANHTIAVDAYHPFVPMGTRIVMNGVEYTVEDTGNFHRFGVQFDVYYDSHWAASLHGHRTWEAFIADDNGDQVVEVTQTVTKHILTVTVTNHSLEEVVDHWGLTDDQRERYRLLVELKGNREDLFAQPASLMTQEAAYQVPGHALTNERFARMVQEAEKYLGYPYVWGGSSPATSFDCSGFVCWVINHSGNGWNVGRTTAEGLHQMLPVIRPEEAQPGDIILFQGTYRTRGASHVGIYVGNGMMIHAGNPIKYASINSNYFRAHFLCFCRLP